MMLAGGAKTSDEFGNETSKVLGAETDTVLDSQQARGIKLRGRGSLSAQSFLFLRKFHMLVGVSFGLYLSMMSLSGAALVFADEIEHYLNRDAVPKVSAAYLGEAGAKSHSKAQPLPLAQIVESIQHYHPGYKVTYFANLAHRDAADEPLEVHAAKEGAPSLSYFVDPISGAELKEISENKVLAFVKDLHHNLLNGKPGRKVNGYAALLFQVLAISGLYLFLRTGGMRAANLAVKTGAGKISSLRIHRTLGVVSLPFIAIWTVSALNFAFPQETRAVLSAMGIPHAQGETVKSELILPDAGKPDLDSVMTMAKELAGPSSVPQELSYPKKITGAYRVWFKDSLGLPTEVWINPDNGNLVSLVGPASCGDVNGVAAWMTRLHFGRFAGVPGKIFWVVIGLAPLALYVTSLISMLNRYRLSKSARQKLSSNS